MRAASLVVLVLAAQPAVADDKPPVRLGPNWTLMWEPGLLIVGTFAIAVEHAVSEDPSIGVAVVVGGGSHQSIAIGDKLHSRYHLDAGNTPELVGGQRWHGGVQTNFYFRRPLSGPHVGLEVTLKQLFPRWGADINVITSSPYLGWKWILRSGFTIALSAGVSLVVTDDEYYMPADPGWHIDDRGSLGDLHLFAGFGVGWSFNDGSP